MTVLGSLTKPLTHSLTHSLAFSFRHTSMTSVSHFIRYSRNHTKSRVLLSLHDGSGLGLGDRSKSVTNSLINHAIGNPTVAARGLAHPTHRPANPHGSLRK